MAWSKVLFIYIVSISLTVGSICHAKEFKSERDINRYFGKGVGKLGFHRTRRTHHKDRSDSNDRDQPVSTNDEPPEKQADLFSTLFNPPGGVSTGGPIADILLTSTQHAATNQ